MGARRLGQARRSSDWRSLRYSRCSRLRRRVSDLCQIRPTIDGDSRRTAIAPSRVTASHRRAMTTADHYPTEFAGGHPERMNARNKFLAGTATTAASD
jgi:hypothetical protein